MARAGVAGQAARQAAWARLRRVAAAAGALAAGQRRRLILWAPVMIGLGVQLWFLAPREPPPWTAALALAPLGLAALRPRGVAFVVAAALACAALGFGAAALRGAAVAAPALPGPATALVEGRVRVVDQSASGRVRLTLDRPRVWGLAGPQPRRLRVTLGPSGAAVVPGTWLSVVASLSPPAGPAEPGGFDFARAAWFDGLGGIGVARGAVAVIDGPPPAGPVEAAALALDRARFALSEGLRAGLPGETGAFAAAIVTGERRGLPPGALEALRTSGLAHLLSISGLHMAVVCGLAFWTARLGLTLVPGLALRAPLHKAAAIAALLAGGAYLALSGGAVPTERAFVMAAVALGAILADRPAVTMRAVALAAALILLRAPESLLDAGFQLSFAATVALVAAWEAARGRLAHGPGLRRAALRFAATLAATSLVAGLATAPFAAFHFQRAASWSLLANLLAVPAMGSVTAPALALSAVAAPFGLQAAPLAVAGLSIDWILGVARWTAALPGAEAALPAAAPAALWAIAAGGLWLCLWAGPLRLGGLAGLALGAALWAGAPRPAILIGADARLAGVLGPQGRAIAGLGRDPYTAGAWLRRDGDRALPAEAAQRPGFAARGAWIEARSGDLTLLMPRRPDRPPDGAEIRRRCVAGVVMVAPAGAMAATPPSPTPPGPCLAVDAAALAASGPAAVTVRDGRPALRLAVPPGRTRRWSRRAEGGPGQ